MFFRKPNFKYAEPVVNLDDLETLNRIGIDAIAESANNGSKYEQALLQRLVNSNELPEGNY